MKKYGKYLLALALCFDSAHGMFSSYPPDRAASIKDFKYRLKKNPCEYFKIGALFSATLAASWYAHPALSVGVSLLMGGFVYIDIYSGATAGIHRRIDHSDRAFAHIDCGSFDEFTTHISKNHYEENDHETLREQNSRYLFDILCKYDQFNHPEANNYLRAAEILLDHHADGERALQSFKNTCPDSHNAHRWFELHVANHKVKLS